MRCPRCGLAPLYREDRDTLACGVCAHRCYEPLPPVTRAPQAPDADPTIEQPFAAVLDSLDGSPVKLYLLDNALKKVGVHHRSRDELG